MAIGTWGVRLRVVMMIVVMMPSVRMVVPGMRMVVVRVRVMMSRMGMVVAAMVTMTVAMSTAAFVTSIVVIGHRYRGFVLHRLKTRRFLR